MPFAPPEGEAIDDDDRPGSRGRGWVLSGLGVATFILLFWPGATWQRLGAALTGALWAFVTRAWPPQRRSSYDPPVFNSPLSAAVSVGVMFFLVGMMMSVLFGGSSSPVATRGGELSDEERQQLRSLMFDCASQTMTDVARTPEVDSASSEMLATALRNALAGCAREQAPAWARCNAEGCFQRESGFGYHWEAVVESWLERCWRPTGAVC